MRACQAHFNLQQFVYRFGIARSFRKAYNDNQASTNTTNKEHNMAEETGTARSHMYKHQDIVDWLTEQGHITPKSTQAEVVAAFAAQRNAYRKTDRYHKLVDAHKGDAEAAKAERAAAREAAKAAKAAEAAKAPKAEKAAKPTKAATKAATKAPAKAAKKAKASDSPFD